MTRRIAIVGAGHAGVQLADSLRDEGFDGDVVLVSEEHVLPYQRPPLTKELLHSPAPADLLPLRAESFYDSRRLDLRLGQRAVSIDRKARRLLLDDASTLQYDQLVLATGARARQHPAMRSSLLPVQTIRTAGDARRFGRELETAGSLAIVGAGFIGLEVAAAARARGVEVTIVTSKLPLSRMATTPLSEYLLQAHRARGSVFVFDEAVSTESSAGSAGASIVCASGRRVTADHVLVAIGARPNSELAAAAGLLVSSGIAVDEFSRTSDELIWAIGDVTMRRVPDWRMTREESVQAATHQARCLARTLTGSPTQCTEVPWFWSNQGELRLQIAGVPDPSGSAVVRGDPASGRFSVFNFIDGRLRAVESVSRPSDHTAARRILAAGIRLEPEQAADVQFDLKAYSRVSARGQRDGQLN
jgi:3-phenylpropionate/trans-cinnamate dioxygenase ferredoxin reductase subunit